jgi:YggT family protein
MSTALINIIAFLLELGLNLAQVMVLAAVLISWVGADPYNPLVQTIKKLTDPLFKPFQGLNSKLNLPIDLSPLIVLLIITTLQRGVLPAIKIALLQPQ